MPALLRFARRALGQMTEVEAMYEYLAHMRTCSKCGVTRSSTGGTGNDRCSRGGALHAAWIAAGEREAAEAQGAGGSGR